MTFSAGFGKPPQPPVEYVISCVGPQLYSIAKFAGGEVPEDTYQVDMSKPSKPCYCPAWRSGKTRPCKHAAMVEAYVEAGEPTLGEYVCLGKGKEWVFRLKGKLYDTD